MTAAIPLRHLAALLALAAPPLAHPAEAEIRPGLWEFRSTCLNVAGLPDLSGQMARLQQQLGNLPPDTQRMLRQQMAARGLQLGSDGTVRSCVTPEMARQDAVYAGRTDGHCVLASVERSANTVRGRLDCSQPRGSADFDTQVHSSEHMTTRVQMHAAQGEVQMETDARWIAAQCPAPRPQP